MNPAIILIAVLYCITLWFALSGQYRLIGRFLKDIFNSVEKEIKKEDEDE